MSAGNLGQNKVCVTVTRDWRRDVGLINHDGEILLWDNTAQCWKLVTESSPKREDRLAGCGNSPSFGGERAFVTVVEADFSVERSVFFEFGIAVSRDFVHLVRSAKSEPDAGIVTLALEAKPGRFRTKYQ